MIQTKLVGNLILCVRVNVFIMWRTVNYNRQKCTVNFKILCIATSYLLLWLLIKLIIIITTNDRIYIFYINYYNSLKILIV